LRWEREMKEGCVGRRETYVKNVIEKSSRSVIVQLEWLDFDCQRSVTAETLRCCHSVSIISKWPFGGMGLINACF
jgi:hypothetical protein